MKRPSRNRTSLPALHTDSIHPWRTITLGCFIRTNLLLLVVWLVSGLPVFAELRLPSYFGSHMVLQADQPIAVRGWAAENASVQVSFAGRSETVRADESGRWRVTFPALKAAFGPLEMIVRSGDETIVLADVRIGEVWLATGQSNMEVGLGKDAGNAIPTHETVRIFVAETTAHGVEQDDLPGTWSVTEPGPAAESFSAVGYTFAVELAESLGVPVGIVQSTKGGTHIEQWLSRADYEKTGTDAEDRLAAIDANRDALIPAWNAYFSGHQAWKERERSGERLSRKDRPKAPELPELGRYRSFPSVCYNSFLHPLTGHAFRGVLWYQGESNAGIFGWKQPEQYGEKLQTLIERWRTAFANPGLTTLIVQLPNYGNAADRSGTASPDGWGEVRTGQWQVSRNEPRVDTMEALDLGGNLHPELELKQILAQRLTLGALATTYGQTGFVFSGPEPIAAEWSNDEIRIQFSHVGDGLIDQNGGELEGFVVETQEEARSGIRSLFQPVSARLEGNEVVLTTEDASDVTGIGYALSKNSTCDLFNRNGFPAAAFLLPVE